MLKRPSSRRKTGSQIVALNLVPMLDAMITLITFLLLTASFLSIVSIESPFPMASPREIEQKLQDKPLQLTVSVRENETEIWSPFERIASKTVPNKAPNEPDLTALHAELVAVKGRYPAETKVVIVPVASVTYDTLIAVMDTMRMMEPTDTPIFAKNEATGNDEPVKTLFPEVVFGNLLGDS